MARKEITLTLEKKFIAYGHYELTVKNGDETKSAICDNVELIERLNSEDEKERKEATTEAIAFVNFTSSSS